MGQPVVAGRDPADAVDAAGHAVAVRPSLDPHDPRITADVQFVRRVHQPVVDVCTYK